MEGRGLGMRGYGRSRVFVSYAHDSVEHKKQVLSLCEILAAQGVDVHLDQWVAGRVIWAEWAEEGLHSADFVLVVASPLYKARVDGARPDLGSGALYETRQLRDLVTGMPDLWHRKILPVLLPGHAVDEIPRFLLPHTGTRYELSQISEVGVGELLATLSGPPVPPVPAGRE